MSDIDINCPQCEEQFSVDKDLLGKKFECGACSHHFKVELQTKKQKFYPGEKKTVDLNQFGADPVSEKVEQVEFKKASYSETTRNDFEKINTAPFRLLAIIAAVVILIVGFYLVITAIYPDGKFFTLKTKQKMTIAALASAFSVAGFAYGFKNHRVVAILVSCLTGAVLCYIPVHFKNHFRKEWHTQNQSELFKDKIKDSDSDLPEFIRQPNTSKKEQEYSLKHAISYDKFLALKESAPDKITSGVLVYNLQQEYEASLKEFYQQALGLDTPIQLFRSKYLLNGKPAALLAIQHTAEQTKELEALIALYAADQEVNDELNITTVTIADSVIFKRPETPVEQLPEIQQFRLAMLDIGHINLSRQKAALVKIQSAKRLYYASEVLIQLARQINSRDEEFQKLVLGTVNHWNHLIDNHEGFRLDVADDKKKIDDAVLHNAKNRTTKNLTVHVDILNYLAYHQIVDSEQILLDNWKKAPVTTEFTMKLGRNFTKSILEGNLVDLDANLLNSACNILSVIGDQQTILALRKLSSTEDGQKIKDSLTSTIDAIKKRL